MRYLVGCLTLVTVALLAFNLSAPTASARPATSPESAALAQQAAPLPKCCFTNSRYTGTCEVTPTKDESCGKILDYLNNPSSQGKSYCGNTQIRGGWQSVSCEKK